MKHLPLTLLALALASSGLPRLQAQAKPDTGPAVRYTVSFPNAVHHEAR